MTSVDYNRTKKTERLIKVLPNRILKTTPVFESYWRFAKARQDVFMQRVIGKQGPWTDDPIITAHKFTNTYRASDRVSQYLIRNVIYKGIQSDKEIFFRIISVIL